MRERWKGIPRCEGTYMVSDHGRVMSAPRTAHYGQVLALNKSRSGYAHVCLSIDGKKRDFAVHRLVAIAFLDNPKGKREVNHINGDRADNRVENLEWATRSENERHAFRCLGKKPNAPWRGKPRKCARRFTPEQIRLIRSDTRSNSEIAAEHGVSKTAIRDIKIRKNYREVI